MVNDRNDVKNRYVCFKTAKKSSNNLINNQHKLNMSERCIKLNKSLIQVLKIYSLIVSKHVMNRLIKSIELYKKKKNIFEKTLKIIYRDNLYNVNILTNK